MTNTNRSTLFAGLSLTITPLILQVPFGLLAAKYDYPDILLRDAGEVLTRFHAGGAGMIWTWWVYALCTVGLLVAALNLKTSRFATAAGVIAAFAQLLGLLRWVFVVPFLADAWVNNTVDHGTLSVIFEVQHRLFGVLLGEHVGQLFMALWTASVAWELGPKWVRTVGLLSALTLLLGLGAGLARVVPMPHFVAHFPLVGFLLWVVWAVATGIVLLRSRVSSKVPALVVSPV